MPVLRPKVRGENARPPESGYGNLIRSPLFKRVATASVLVAALLPSLFLLPAPAWNVACAAFAGICAYEWFRLCGLKGVPMICCTGLIVAIFATAAMDAVPSRWVWAASTVIWVCAVPLVLWNNAQTVNKFVRMISGGIVIVSAAIALVMLRSYNPGLLLVLMAIVWVSDSAAYFSGRTWGHRKLAPSISPGKTWEGVAGGLFAVLIYALLVKDMISPALTASSISPSGLGSVLVVLLFLGLAVAGIIGDLAESWAKRLAGVKDSGTILPGHGGILDRVDALLPVLPIAALIFCW